MDSQLTAFPNDLHNQPHQDEAPQQEKSKAGEEFVRDAVQPQGGQAGSADNGHAGNADADGANNDYMKPYDYYRLTDNGIAYIDVDKDGAYDPTVANTMYTSTAMMIT